MKYLAFFLFSIVFCFIFNLIGLAFGFMLFYFSRTFSFSRLEHFSIKVIAYADAPFFGAHKHWIFRHCPSSDCVNCRLWTCSGKEVK